MSKHLRYLTVVLAWFCAIPVFAQQDPIASQYHLNPAMINPAYTGLYNSFLINANSRVQWMGMEGSPFSNFLTVSTSLVEKRVGGGVYFSQDNLGITSNTEFGLQGAYRIEFDRSTFAFGIQSGFINLKDKNDELTLRHTDDPNFPPGRQSVMKPNFGAGIAWLSDRYYVGLSVPRLLDVKLDDGFSETEIYRRHMYVSGALLFDVTPMAKLKPVALIRYVAGAPLSFDVGANMLWNHKFWAGVYTRNFTTQGALFQLLVNQTVRLGYAIEVPTSKNLETRFITHELVVGIDLSLFRDQDAFLRYF